jgi:hypothetical protein
VKHLLFNVLAVVSLALCVTAIVLWWNSYSVWDTYFFIKENTPNRQILTYWMDRDYGIIALGVSQRRFDSARDAEIFAAYYHHPDGFQKDPVPTNIGTFFPSSPFWNRLGFGFLYEAPFRSSDPGPVAPLISRWGIYFPYWFIVLLTAILPLMAIRATLKHRGNSHDALCRKCGYDLRATPDRCPECGTIPKNRKKISN